MTRFTLPASTVCAMLVASAPALATTWIVDDEGGPGVDFTDIQSAVDVAVDGDVIEVRRGDYAGFTIDGESLVVVKVGKGIAEVTSGVTVRNVPAAGRVELDGLRFVAPSPTVLLESNDGSVRLVDCNLTQSAGGGNPRTALRTVASLEVVLTRCTVTATSSGYGGIQAVESILAVLDCSVAGQTATTPSGDGGSGITLSTSTLFSHRSTFLHGTGGTGSCETHCLGPECSVFQYVCPPGDDGAGVRISTGSTAAWKDSTGTVDGPGSLTEVAIAPYCLGTFEECPCGNHGAGTAGCEHSFGSGGARLEGVGNASVASDTVTLQVTGLNPNASPTALFFQGTTGSEGTPFNDGLLCAGGTIRRLKGKLAQNGAVSFGFGQPGDATVSAAGNVPPAGATRFYQVWYRNNAAAFCTPLRFNMSNGVEIAWAP